MQRIYIKDLSSYIDQDVSISGWVHVRRDQGKMIFLDIRDMSGRVQGVVLSQEETALLVAKELRSEYVVCIVGHVVARPEKNRILDMVNGGIELQIKSIEILNKTETPPFDITENTASVSEALRLEYRYLDMRSERVQKNIRNRHNVVHFIRNWLSEKDFTEIETPLLTASTPEGSRDFLVPSRLEKGSFYALPQSPQQFKQLLMTGGIEKYFQIARCMRDEDSRGDRQPEFTQLDMEMSFVKQEDVMALNEALLIALIQKLYPEKKIQEIPFPRITYKEAMETYGNDRPDIRQDKTDQNLLAFCWVIDFPFFEPTEGSDNPDVSGAWTFTHNPFSTTRPDHLENLKNKENIGDIIAAQYDITLNGYEIGGGSIRNHAPELLKTVFEIMGYADERIEKNFGHMLRAFRMGTPPHGGIAWGLDRLMMLLENEPNIREVIAFPKNGEAHDLMMNAPSSVPEKSIAELGISIKTK